MSRNLDMQAVDVEDMLARLQIDNARQTSRGDEINFSCPLDAHWRGDEHPSAYINTETTAWMCHSCHARGNAVTLVAQTQRIPNAQAARWLVEAYGGGFREPREGSVLTEIEALLAPPSDRLLRRPPEAFQNYLSFNWSSDPLGLVHHYILDRGFSMETLQDWEIGHDEIEDRVTIPFRDINGELVGVKARGYRDDQRPKYLIYGDYSGQTRYGFDIMEAAEVVFGLNRARGYRKAAICEGELDAIMLSQIGVKRPIAVGGSFLSDEHARLIAREVDELIVFFDSDESGREGVSRVIGVLADYCYVRVVPEHDGDPADLGEAALELIAQAQGATEALLR